MLRPGAKPRSHIARLASEDPLTGLPNRRVFRTKIEKLCGSGSEANAQPRDFAVLFLDLDRFKAINDTLGHRVGDMLLVEVAQRLRTSLSLDKVSARAVLPRRVLARLGGDEFAIVLPAFDSAAAIETLAYAIVETIGRPYEIDGHHIRSSVSIGIAIGPRDGKSADDILMAADLALYAVKTSGRGTYLFYQPVMNHEVNDRRQIEMDLREAIEQNALHLEYQPIIDLRRNAVVGFEALARWRHATRGAISPADFIPIAEDSGLILPLGEWALREACTQAARWPNELKIAVNLSPVQFSLANFPDIVLGILADTGLAPERLVLEITERLFISDIDKALAILHRLKALGIGIAMDDFGIGYSSLSLLRSFPFDRNQDRSKFRLGPRRKHADQRHRASRHHHRALARDDNRRRRRRSAGPTAAFDRARLRCRARLFVQCRRPDRASSGADREVVGSEYRGSEEDQGRLIRQSHIVLRKRRRGGLRPEQIIELGELQLMIERIVGNPMQRHGHPP